MSSEALEDSPSDADLLRSAVSGDFGMLYRRYAEALYSFALRRTGDHAAAVDITAETMARAWSLRERYRDPGSGSVGPWLFGIAKLVVLESVRAQRMQAELARRVGLTLHSDSVPALAWLDGLDADLELALATLPPAQRAAVTLRVMADQDYETVAHELGCTPSAARIKVSRGLSTLRSTLNSQEETS